MDRENSGYESSLGDKTEKSSDCSPSFLGHKRHIKNLKENYVFRRVLNGKLLGKYEEIANLYFNLFSFNWDDDKLFRKHNSVMQNLNANSFWFAVCSIYFPACSEQLLLEEFKILDEVFKQIIERNVAKSIVKKKSPGAPKTRLIRDLSSILQNDEPYNEHDGNFVPIDSLIDKVTKHISHIRTKNKTYFKEIFNTRKTNLSDGDESNFLSINGAYNPDDILTDMQYKNYPDFIKEYFTYLIKLNEYRAAEITEDLQAAASKKRILSRKEEETIHNQNPDEIVCLVCNDGDYEENDLIVYCSSCQMTVHQNCYGIIKLPKEDWLCHACLVFGKIKAKELECVLCPVKGGAMKPSCLKLNSAFNNYVSSLRQPQPNEKNNIIKLELNVTGNNEDESLFPEKNIATISSVSSREGLANDSPFKVTKTPRQPNNDKDNSVETNKTSLNKANGVYIENKDQKLKEWVKLKSQKEKTEEERKVKSFNQFINPKTVRENAWVHLSCALWTPEIIINNFAEKEEIKNFDGIGKQRFTEMCSICSRDNYGPTIKCKNQQCNLKFHVECARINKFQLEAVNNSAGELNYYIYCQIHRPHHLIKHIELNKQRCIDDITNFAKLLEKNFEILHKFDKRNDFSIFSKNKKGKLGKVRTGDKIKAQRTRLNAKEKARLICLVRAICKDLSSLRLGLKEVQHDGAETSYKIEHTEKIKLSYYDTLDPNKFPWYIVKIKNLSPFEIYCAYAELVPNAAIYASLVLKKNNQLKMGKKKKDAIMQENNKEQEDIYCYCKKPSLPGDFMISCYYEDKCVNNSWFHQECVPELKELPREKIEHEDFVFTCRECEIKYSHR